jgi:prophage regulatory protein
MEQIERLSTVKARTGLSRSSIYDLIKKGKFPSPIKLGLRSVGWVHGEVTGWIEERIASSRPAKG